MIFEWLISALVDVMRTMIGFVEGLLPGFSVGALSGVIGTAFSLNAVLPVAELVAVGGSILTWRVVSGPLTAIIARWRFGFRIW